MSYDLMVFDPEVAPRDRAGFMAWYEDQTEWQEDHSYQDPVVSTHALGTYFSEMVMGWPALNGPYSDDAKIDDPRITDYSIGKHIIYMCFGWSKAEEAYQAVRELAVKHGVGFFNVSADEFEISFP